MNGYRIRWGRMRRGNSWNFITAAPARCGWMAGCLRRMRPGRKNSRLRGGALLRTGTWFSKKARRNWRCGMRTGDCGCMAREVCSLITGVFWGLRRRGKASRAWIMLRAPRSTLNSPILRPAERTRLRRSRSPSARIRWVFRLTGVWRFRDFSG